MTLAGDTDNFRIEPIVPLPKLVFNEKGVPWRRIRPDQRIYPETYLGQTYEMVAKDPDAMAVLRQIGSDVLTNSFVVNFRGKGVGGKDGSWNVDLEKCKELNIRLLNMFSIVDDTSEEQRKKVELVLTLSEIDSKHYSIALKNVCQNLGLKYEQQVRLLSELPDKYYS